MMRLGIREIGVCVAIASALCGTTAVAQQIGATLYAVDIQMTPADSGAVTRTPDAAFFEAGEFVTVTAQPADGFEFVGWEGDIVAEETSLTFEVTGDTILTAVFGLAGTTAPHQLSALVDPPGSGSIVRDPAEFGYDNGAVLTLTAYAHEGFVFSGWTGDVPAGANPNNPTLTLTMNGDTAVQATFAAGLILSGPPYALFLESDPPAGGQVASFPNAFEFNEGEIVTVTATPAAGFEFVGWEGDVTSAVSTITVEMTDHTSLQAIFAEVNGASYLLTALANPAGGGSIVREPSATEYVNGTEVTLTAYPLEGFVFAGWVGHLPANADANDPVLVLTMTANLDIAATFAAGQTLDDQAGGFAPCGAMGMVGLGMMFSMMLMMKLSRVKR